MCETVVDFAPKGEFLIPNDPENIDGLNFLAGKPLSFVAEKAMRGVMLAHVDGGVPNVLIQMPAISETSVGFLIYFFEYVCGLSGHLLEINPFNQPGVEAIRAICSPFWASPATRPGRPSWRPACKGKNTFRCGKKFTIFRLKIPPQYGKVNTTQGTSVPGNIHEGVI